MAEKSKPLARAGGRIKRIRPRQIERPREGVKRWLLTSAQENTYVHEGFWDNLRALAEHVGAEVKVSRFTYNQMIQAPQAKPGREPKSSGSWWDPSIVKHVCDERLQLASSLIFVGEANILPTAVRPLLGFETLTGRKSGIFPHAKLEMQSVASGKFEGTKLNFTTGACTRRNYLQKRAGLRAEGTHCYGALMVEVDSQGDWFVRQVQGNERGVIHDLDVRVENGSVSSGNPVEAVTWGDAHAWMVDEKVRAAAWGPGGMLDELQPRHQFVHDLFDHRARNHHELDDPHRMFERYAQKAESIDDELADAARLLAEVEREWCRTVVVKSNHDDALEKWLRRSDWRDDVRNAEFYLEANLALLRALKEGRKDHLTIEWSLRNRGGYAGHAQFLHDDESFVICRDEDGGIECGMHGHLGSGGKPGTVSGFAKMGRRLNIGDKHRAEIYDGVYVAGTSGKVDVGWNKGPSAWTHSHIVTYPTGMRSLVTMWNGKWRAR